MNKLFENVNHLLLVMIVGVASLAVTYVGEIAKNTQNMALSVQELNIKMGQVSEAVRDHELRLRSIENQKSTRR